MTDDTLYTKREQDHFFRELFKRMDSQDKSLERIETQTTKTNGRVTALESTLQDYPEVKKKVSQLDNYKWWIIGVAATLSITGLLAMKQIVKQSVDIALLARVTNVSK